MSKALKCDRCYMYFDPYDLCEKTFIRFRNPAYENENATKSNQVAGYFFEKEGPDGIVDLCPDCSRDFEDFMKNKNTFHSGRVVLDFNKLDNLTNKSDKPTDDPLGSYHYSGPMPKVTYE